MSRSIIYLILILLFSNSLVTAQQQDDPPAPQFLYIDDNTLVLVDGYTGETSELPIEVGERDRFEWSTGGKYLLAYLDYNDSSEECINLFDIDTNTWIYDDPIACGWVRIRAIFSADDTLLIYTILDQEDGVQLYSFNLVTNDTTLLYERFSESQVNDVGIDMLEWSPTSKYLTAVSYLVLMSGESSSFLVVNMETLNYATIHAPDTFYANYYPIWSYDDQWMLLRMKDQSIVSGITPFSNDEGDVYLANSDTGETTRLTYTPTIREENIAWTENGEITYSEVVLETMTITIEQAQSVPTVAWNEIIEPEPYERESNVINNLRSPDPTVNSQRVTTSDGITISISNAEYNTVYSVTIDSSNHYEVIGWRPTNYSYPQG